MNKRQRKKAEKKRKDKLSRSAWVLFKLKPIILKTVWSNDPVKGWELYQCRGK